MIDKSEIEEKSKELSVHTSNVQRDYVFGWLLSGFYQQSNPLSNRLILKGGNAFRKAFFEHARYSNDLDFSTQSELNESTLINSIKQACEYASDLSKINFLLKETKINQREVIEDDKNLYEARIYFKSFYGEENFTIKVDLDIKEFDKIILPLQRRKLIHSYSDFDICGSELICQKLEELLASKLKALLQRRHSPDLYDFVHSIFFQKVLDINRI